MSTSMELELIFIALCVILAFCFGIVRVTLSVIDKRVRALWRIEAKIDLLLSSAGIKFDPYQSLPKEVVDAIARGERVRAMHYYREASGAGIKEARDFIDEAARRAKAS
jgi:ribosomal protein L7/L12